MRSYKHFRNVYVYTGARDRQSEIEVNRCGIFAAKFSYFYLKA